MGQRCLSTWTKPWREVRLPRPHLLHSRALSLPPTDPPIQRWLWYDTETADCVSLDRSSYVETLFDGRRVPLPEWVCTAPDGGLHKNADLLALDVDIAEAPNTCDELNWTCEYVVKLVAHSWLDEIRDLIDEERIGLGVLRQNGEVVSGWSTIHERRPPVLLATEGHVKTCPICGHSYTVLHGREYFSDPEVIGRPLIVNSNGLFVREDIARSRNLRTPRGAFEPGVIEFEATGF